MIASKDLDLYINTFAKKKKMPGLSVKILHRAGDAYCFNYGFRDFNQENPVNNDTVFGIASMSKSMAAVACAILHIEDKLNIYDPVSKYIPSFHIPLIPDQCVTLDSLLNHRSGLPPIEPLEWSIAMNSKERETSWYNAMRKNAPNKMDTIEKVIKYISNLQYDLVGFPGENMSYSNEGYAILSYIVDIAAGISLEDFLKERIYKPLNMTRTVLDIDGREATKLADGNITELFDRDVNDNLYSDNNWSILPPFRASACVKSTTNDMCKYYMMIAQNGEFDGKQIVAPEAISLMTGPRFPLRNKPYYGMGLYKQNICFSPCFYHFGGLRGVSSCGGFVGNNYSFTILCNEGDVDVEPIQWAIYNFIHGLDLDTNLDWKQPLNEDFQDKEMVLGEYVAHEGLTSVLSVFVKNDHLFCILEDIQYEMHYCGQTIFKGIGEKDGEKTTLSLEFLVRNGKTWGARVGSRIYSKISLGGV